MNNQIYLPETFDSEKHIREWEMTVRIPVAVKPAYLEYIIHLLVYKSSFNNKYENHRDGFIPLYSKDLARLTPKYKAHLDYLIATKVILKDSYYSIESGVTKAYKLTYKYRCTPVVKKISDSKLLRKLKTLVKPQLESIKRANQKYPYLGKSFDGLWIDKVAARSYVKGLHAMGIIYFTGDKRENFEQKITQMYINIDRIDSKDFSYIIDETGHRFHSNLTAIKKELRHYLTHRGRKLASLDFKNSQPFLSQVLFNLSFWKERVIDNRTAVQKSRDRKRTGATSPQGTSNAENRYQESEGKIAYNDVIALQGDSKGTQYDKENILTDSTRQSIIMFLIKQQESNNQDVTRFQKLISDGTFYEYVFTQLQRTLRHDTSLCKLYNQVGKTKIDRDFAKYLTMIALFSPPKSRNPSSVLARRFFKSKFPTVIEVFRLIKRKDHTLLAVLLQRIEAELILNRICRKFHNKYQQPIFTVHDSIVTLKTHLPKLKKIVLETIKEAIGSEPQLQQEDWDPMHLKNVDVLELFRKSEEIVYEVKDCVKEFKDGSIEFVPCYTYSRRQTVKRVSHG